MYSLLLPSWITQGDIHTSLMNIGRKTYSASWSTQLLIAVYLKPGLLSSPSCAEGKISCSAAAVLSHTQRYSLSCTGTSSLPISVEPFSVLGIYWSVTFHPEGLSQPQVDVLWAQCQLFCCVDPSSLQRIVLKSL